MLKNSQHRRTNLIVRLAKPRGLAASSTRRGALLVVSELERNLPLWTSATLVFEVRDPHSKNQLRSISKDNTDHEKQQHRRASASRRHQRGVTARGIDH